MKAGMRFFPPPRFGLFVVPPRSDRHTPHFHKDFCVFNRKVEQREWGWGGGGVATILWISWRRVCCARVKQDREGKWNC